MPHTGSFKPPSMTPTPSVNAVLTAAAAPAGRSANFRPAANSPIARVSRIVLIHLHARGIAIVQVARLAGFHHHTGQSPVEHALRKTRGLNQAIEVDAGL